MSLFNRYHEIPPTAGLPTYWRDWLTTPSTTLASQASHLFNLPPMQLTCSGTMALVIALKTLANHYPTRKTVIIPAFTCPLVALAIHHCGLEIKLCDLAEKSFDLDFNHLELLLNEQVLAIIPTHLGGRIANVSKVKALATPYTISVIEDAAQAFGAEVGKQGDITFFSLAAGKGLTLFEGGLLTSPDGQIREQLQQVAMALAPKNISWELKRTVELFGYTLLYNPIGLHFAYGNPKRKALKDNQLVEAVGDQFDFDLPLHQVSYFRQRVAANSIKRLPAFIEKTTQQALVRIDRLHQIEGIKVLTDNSTDKGVWPFLMVLCPNTQIRDNILDHLWAGPLGITRLFIHALPDYTYLSAIIPETSVPNAQSFANKMFTITNSLWLTDEQFEKVLMVIQQCLTQNKD